MLLGGMSFFGDPFSISAEWTEENEIGRLWNRFIAYLMKEDWDLLSTEDRTMYEVHTEHDETDQKGNFEVFVGKEVDTLDKVPVELLVKVLPASTYAVFTLKGADITSDWPRAVYQEWLPASDYRLAHPFGFQLYDERFKGMDKLKESTLDVYVPVIQKRQP